MDFYSEPGQDRRWDRGATMDSGACFLSFIDPTVNLCKYWFSRGFLLSLSLFIDRTQSVVCFQSLYGRNVLSSSSFSCSLQRQLHHHTISIKTGTQKPHDCYLYLASPSGGCCLFVAVISYFTDKQLLSAAACGPKPMLTMQDNLLLVPCFADKIVKPQGPECH